MGKNFKHKANCKKCGKQIHTNWSIEALDDKKLTHIKDKHGVNICNLDKKSKSGFYNDTLKRYF